MTKALLVDVAYCTGCHACEVACQKERGLSVDKLGIVLHKIGPFQITDKKWQYDFFVTPTAFCNACNPRTAKGKLPSCVQHCQTGCLEVGDLEVLKAKMSGSKKLIFAI